MNRCFFTLGCLSASLGVVLGAFAAHALRGQLAADMLNIFEVGVRYQMYHAIALLAAASACAHWPRRSTTAAGWLFVAGAVIFSGSLYVLSVTGMRWLGAITPIGGMAFIVGWLCLAFAPFASRERR